MATCCRVVLFIFAALFFIFGITAGTLGTLLPVMSTAKSTVSFPSNSTQIDESLQFKYKEVCRIWEFKHTSSPQSNSDSSIAASSSAPSPIVISSSSLATAASASSSSSSSSSKLDSSSSSSSLHLNLRREGSASEDKNETCFDYCTTFELYSLNSTSLDSELFFKNLCESHNFRKISKIIVFAATIFEIFSFIFFLCIQCCKVNRSVSVLPGIAAFIGAIALLVSPIYYITSEVSFINKENKYTQFDFNEKIDPSTALNIVSFGFSLIASVLALIYGGLYQKSMCSSGDNFYDYN